MISLKEERQFKGKNVFRFNYEFVGFFQGKIYFGCNNILEWIKFRGSMFNVLELKK